MPITMYKDYRYSYTPSYRSSHTTSSRTFTLPKAFEMVVSGEVGAIEVFKQSPDQVQKIINEACQACFGAGFMNLTDSQQKDVFTMFLIAIGNKEENEKPVITEKSYSTVPCHKKWWQFWR